jgi:choline-glycine betaine transporter
MEKIITVIIVAVPLLIITIIAVGSLIVPLMDRDRDPK